MLKLLLASAALVGIVVCSEAALAQTAETNTAPAAGLEEIVVTAQRRSEDLQRAAISISAISADDIINRGISDPSQLSQLTPALQSTVVNGPYSFFSIRGVNSFNANSFADATITTNVDGVPVSRPSGSHGMMYDLERVEVLKGPQGVLYGRNSSGGAINFITRRPVLNEFSGDVGLDIGNYNLVNINGALNVPLGDKAALRTAVNSIKRDGYYSNGLDDADVQAGRVSLLLAPSDPLEIIVRGDYAKQGGKGPGVTAVNYSGELFYDDPWSHELSDTPEIFLPVANGGNGVSGAGGIYSHALPQGKNFQDNVFWGVMSEVNWTLPLGTLTVIPAYRKVEVNYFSHAPSFLIIDDAKTSTKTLEARFASDQERALRFIFGGFYSSEGTHSTNRVEQHYQGTWSNQFFNLDGETKALFGSATWALSDTIRVNGGLRRTWEEKSADVQRYTQLYNGVGETIIDNPPPAPNPSPLIPTSFPGALDTDFQDTKTWSATNWRLGLEWDIAEHSLLYATAETGFKAGGFFFVPNMPQLPAGTSPSAPAPAGTPHTFEPEKVTAYTLGSKNRFFDNRLQANLELFWYDYKNQQLTHITLVSGVAVNVTDNAGASTNKGVELDLQYLLTDRTMLKLQAQHLKTRYDDLTYRAPGGPTAPPYTGCSSSFDSSQGNWLVDCEGKRQLQSPEWTISAGIEQSFELPNAGELVANLNSSYESERETLFGWLPQNLVGDNVRTDFSLGYAAPRKTWSATAYVNNIEDDAVIGNTFNNAGIRNPNGSQGALRAQVTAAVLRAPRTYGIRLTARF